MYIFFYVFFTFLHTAASAPTLTITRILLRHLVGNQLPDNLQILSRNLAFEPLITRIGRQHIHDAITKFEFKESRIPENINRICVVSVYLNNFGVKCSLNLSSDINVIRFDWAGISILAVLDDCEHGLSVDILLKGDAGGHFGLVGVSFIQNRVKLVNFMCFVFMLKN